MVESVCSALSHFHIHRLNSVILSHSEVFPGALTLGESDISNDSVLARLREWRAEQDKENAALALTSLNTH